MPLFFFFSGVVAHSSDNLMKDLIKSFRSLYIPFAFFTFIDILILAIKSFYHHDIDFLYLIKYSFRLLTGLSTPYFNVPIWFLFSLFTIRILFHLICHGQHSILLFSIIFVLCVAYSFLLYRFSIPYSLFLPTVISFPFFILGWFYKNVVFQFIKNVPVNFLFYLGIGIVFLLLITGCKLNSTINIHGCTVGNSSLFYINSFLGIFFTICICKIIDVWGMKNHIMNYIRMIFLFFGKNSVYILVTHYYLTRHIFPFILAKLGLSDYLYSISVELILFFFTVLIMVPICIFFRKHLLFLFGKSTMSIYKNR